MTATLTRLQAGAAPELVPGEVLVLRVTGNPVPEGSLVSFADPRTGKIITKPQLADLAPWRRTVSKTAQIWMGGRSPVRKPRVLLLGCEFRLDRDRVTKSGARRPGSGSDWPLIGNDQDKLVRAVRDALTGIVYEDDGQVIGSSICDERGVSTVALPDFKRWTRPGECPGVVIRMALVAAAQRALLEN